jgi:hypothetical protein
MGTGLIGDGINYANPATGCIIIGDDLPNGLFRWERPDDQEAVGLAGGGGISGVTIHDAHNSGVGRNYDVHSIIRIDDAPVFDIDACTIDKIKGRAVYVGGTNVARITRCQFASNGDTGENPIPTIDIPDLETDLYGAFISESIFHNAVSAPYIVVESGRSLQLRDCYFESNSTNHPTIVDASDGGKIYVDNCWMSSFQGQALKLGGAYSSVRNTYIENGTSSPVIEILAQFCVVENCQIVGGTGKAIGFGSNCGYGHISNCWLYYGGNIDASNVDHEQINNVYILQCLSTESHQIKSSVDGEVVGCVINGNGSSTVSGIQGNGAVIAGNFVVKLAGSANGIVSTSSEDVLTGNSVVDIGTGAPYVFVAGTNAVNNYPWPEGLVYKNAAASSAVTSTTETDFDKSYTIAANRLRVGAVIRVRAQAFVTSAAGGGTLTLRLKIGSTVIQSTGAVAAGSNFVGYFGATLIVRTIGAAGTIVGTTEWALGTFDAVTPIIGFLASTSIDTTAAQTVKASAQWSNSSNSVRLDILTVEILGNGEVG